MSSVFEEPPAPPSGSASPPRVSKSGDRIPLKKGVVPRLQSEYKERAPRFISDEDREKARVRFNKYRHVVTPVSVQQFADRYRGKDISQKAGEKIANLRKQTVSREDAIRYIQNINRSRAKARKNWLNKQSQAKLDEMAAKSKGKGQIRSKRDKATTGADRYNAVLKALAVERFNVRARVLNA